MIALALMNLLFSLLYYAAPNRSRSRWRWTSSGAVLATSLWAVVSLGFSIYTSSFGTYAKTYGAFAGVVILIFWLFLTGLAILVGGEVNAAVERRGCTRWRRCTQQWRRLIRRQTMSAFLSKEESRRMPIGSIATERFRVSTLGNNSKGPNKSLSEAQYINMLLILCQ